MKNRILKAIDFLLEDFRAEDIEIYFQDIFKNHLRATDGYSHEILADQYEIGLRILDILKDREKEIKLKGINKKEG